MNAAAKRSKWGLRWWWIPQLLALPVTGLAWMGMATDIALLAPLSLLLPYLIIYHVVWSLIASAHLHPSALLGALLLALAWEPMGLWMQVRRPPSALPSENLVRMATWNVHHWRNRSWTEDSATVQAMTEQALALDVDLIALQDVRSATEADRLLKAKLLHHVAAFDLAIYSRYPIVQWDRVEFPGEYEEYGFIWADLALPNGDTLRVVNVHLVSTDVDLRETQNEQAKAGWWWSAKLLLRRMIHRAKPRSIQVDALAAWWAECPTATVVMGDFNDGPTSSSHRRLSAFGSDSFAQAGAGWGSTYRGLHLVPLRIDWIWTSGPWKAVEHRVVKQTWSDHNPVLVALVKGQ